MNELKMHLKNIFNSKRSTDKQRFATQQLLSMLEAGVDVADLPQHVINTAITPEESDA
ncbi:MAG: hypothetical protein ACW99G_18250 [Candidatus Thorarchaeota archaeon]|jgi:hypothetical protein